ncbi:uncharacterized protein FSUBG_10530 [Fusarium subglutinans]|uniref:Uncharacterized protein n=1 Tax=Gibberella subglutinans TaxID=42677 RepID=A0A8H5ULG7_GIBSU|nr:uncharacterized protein FSUBG_10530 [Fusarium subglutinans]KAF5591229.1 hypothetical protein FSUBG_10530 [Fusarium subglutinans]
MKLSSSLIEILGNNDLLFTHEEMALMETVEESEAILGRLKIWFRRKYEDLGRKKDVTKEQGLAEPIFEFPNNIRHTCTTMPWTIFPSLLVLWGVCWMFIIGSSQPDHEWHNAVDPMISPVPAAYDFYTDFHGIGIGEELQGSVADDFDNREHLSQDTLEEFWPGDAQLMNDLIHPFAFAQNTPSDPNFLISLKTSSGDSESLEVAAQDTAEVLPVTNMKDPTHTVCISADNSRERNATGSADSSGYGQRTSNSDESNGKPFKLSPSIQHGQDVGPDEAIRANVTKKRPRAGDDEGSNDEYLLAEMVKKYKEMEKEIKEKQDNL